MTQPIRGAVATKQFLLSICLCEKSRYKLYRKFNGSIYIVDTVNKSAGFFIEFGSHKIKESDFSASSIETYEKITSIDSLKSVMASSYKF